MSHGRRRRPAGDEGRALEDETAAADAAAAQASAAPAGTGAPGAGAVLAGVLEREAQRFLRGSDALAAATLPEPTAEDVHQARVALRRLRSNLRTFGLLVDPRWAAGVRAELAWFGGVLGAVRNLDVLRDRLWTEGPLLAEEDDVRAVLFVLDAQAAVGRQAVVDACRSARGEALAATLRSVSELPLTARADQPADALAPLLERAWHDLRNAGRLARRHPSDRSLHQLRLRTKALRYGCETVATVAGKPAERTARAAARLQDRLGLVRDAAAAEAWLSATASAHPELAGTVERLAVVERAAASVDRRGVGRDLREVERRWRRWRS